MSTRHDSVHKTWWSHVPLVSAAATEATTLTVPGRHQLSINHPADISPTMQHRVGRSALDVKRCKQFYVCTQSLYKWSSHVSERRFFNMFLALLVVYMWHSCTWISVSMESYSGTCADHFTVCLSRLLRRWLYSAEQYDSIWDIVFLSGYDS